MKKLFFIFAIFVFTATLFAQAPELKNMMPNSWGKLTRLSEQEEKDFLNQQQIKSDIEKLKSDRWTPPRYEIKEKRVYKETANKVDFYRVLICNYDMADFLNTEYRDTTVLQDNFEKYIYKGIHQTIYVKQKSKDLYKIRSLESRVYGVTDSMGENKGGNYFQFHDFFIKELNKDEIGFFMTEGNIGFQTEKKGSDVIIDYSKIKKQMKGTNTCEFINVKNKEDFSKAFNNNDRRVRIDASDFLFDSKCPLKYSIQNAFDGNPATSYVENTEDDLMKIDIWLGKAVEKMAIINGYAQNNELYVTVNSHVFFQNKHLI